MADDLIEAHRDELALLETLNVGKPIRDALAIDVPATARCRCPTNRPPRRRR